MDVYYQYESIDNIVAHYFSIDAITRGSASAQQPLVKYIGHLYNEDTAAAYDQLSAELLPVNLMPLFRKEQNRQVVLIVPRLADPRPPRQWINYILYAATLVSLAFVGFINAAGYPGASTFQDQLNLGLEYAFCLGLILTSHELGHYLIGRLHNARVSLPYFIPLPMPPIGTMGAVINMQAPPKNRKTLLDIGIAGPLAGMLVAFPILIFGLTLSSVTRLPSQPGANQSMIMEGNSLLYLASKYLIFKQWLPSPLSFGGLPPLLYWIRYFFTSLPFPTGGMDVTLHPIAWAGWVGMLVTALNLVPAGQLDGGHMLYVLLGAQRARKTVPFIIGALVLLGFVWNGWWLWAALIYFLVGRSYAEPLDQITPLGAGRSLLAVLALLLFVLIFTPVPLM